MVEKKGNRVKKRGKQKKQLKSRNMEKLERKKKKKEEKKGKCWCLQYTQPLTSCSSPVSSMLTTTTTTKSWRSDTLVILPGWECHTGGSRSKPTVHRCSQSGRRLWGLLAKSTTTSPMAQSQCSNMNSINVNMVAEQFRSTA